MTSSSTTGSICRPSLRIDLQKPIMCTTRSTSLSRLPPTSTNGTGKGWQKRLEKLVALPLPHSQNPRAPTRHPCSSTPLTPMQWTSVPAPWVLATAKHERTGERPCAASATVAEAMSTQLLRAARASAPSANGARRLATHRQYV